MIIKELYLYNWLRFIVFEFLINNKTWENQKKYLYWAKRQNKKEENSALFNPSVTFQKLKNVVNNEKKIRILLQVPPSKISPGGYSLFSNLASSLNFIGIPVEVFWDEPIEKICTSFKPTILMTSQSSIYLEKIDWSYLKKYKKNNTLNIGLTTNIYNNDEYLKKNNLQINNVIDFFYTFHSQECIDQHPGYKKYKSNKPLFSIEFGANPLLYHPIRTEKKDLDYIFLASSNYDKWQRYFEYLPPIVNNNPGLIDGPGWHKVQSWAEPKVHKFLYSRAKIGLNLHIQESIDWPSELNERTYILAACGVPRLIDKPLLLKSRFSNNSFFIAENPKEYKDLFYEMLKNPEESKRRAKIALSEVFSKHTTIHRAIKFIRDYKKVFN